MNLRSRKARQEATQGGGPSKPESAAEGAVKKVHKDALYLAWAQETPAKFARASFAAVLEDCKGLDFQKLLENRRASISRNSWR